MGNTQKNNTPRGDRFALFAKSYIPGIDEALASFMDVKMNESTYPLVRKMYSLIKEYCLRRGKRLRPLLLILGYLGYGGINGNLQEIIRVSSILEIMHSLLLIQDDVIDNSGLRRGGRALHLVLEDKFKENTNNKNIGRDLTIIVADVMFSNAMEIFSESAVDPEIKNRFLKVFARTYELTAWGQVFDILHTLPAKPAADNSPAAQISTFKTAYYTMFYPLYMGYILSGGIDPLEEKRIRDCMLPLGLAFQVRDDILGVFGKADETGKSSASDLEEGKTTWLIEYTLKSIDSREHKQFYTILGREEKSDQEIDYLKEVIETSGSRRAAGQKQKALIEESTEKLKNLSMSEDHKLVISALMDRIRDLDL